MLFAAKKLNRPVKWTARRSEAFVSDAHGRDHESVAEMCVDENHKVLALRVRTLANLGAYLTTFAPAVPTYLYGTLLNGTYKWKAIHAHVTGVYTNTVGVDAYRGAGRPEATYLVERMKQIKEGSGTLLDNSMLLFGSALSDGNSHNPRNLPLLLAGKGGNTIKTGRHIKFKQNTALANLYGEIAIRMGLQLDKFGDSNGPLKELAG